MQRGTFWGYTEVPRLARDGAYLDRGASVQLWIPDDEREAIMAAYASTLRVVSEWMIPE